jgi:hypothetical protein
MPVLMRRSERKAPDAQEDASGASNVGDEILFCATASGKEKPNMRYEPYDEEKGLPDDAIGSDTATMDFVEEVDLVLAEFGLEFVIYDDDIPLVWTIKKRRETK